MYLKMVTIEASGKAILPKGFVFRWTAHHVKEIFMELMPSKFYLDGMSKVQITCGPSGNEPKYRRILGTSEYRVEDFDFRAYHESSARERESRILDVLEKTLCSIAEKHGSDKSVIIESAEAVRKHSFLLKKKVSKLSKSIVDHRVNVYRHLSKEDGEAWTLEVVDKKKRIMYEEIIGKKPNYLDMRDVYKKSSIEGGNFVIYNRLGKEVYRCKVL
jgi:hypothetical protein